MAWGRFNKPEVVDLASFDPEADYSARELEAYADAFLKADSKDQEQKRQAGEEFVQTNILFADHLYNRSRREIGNASGIADPTLTAGLQDTKYKKPGRFTGDGQMMYNRTHPRGRKVNSPEQRKTNGASYYR